MVVSAVSLIPLKRFQQCHCYEDQVLNFQQYQLHRGNDFSGVIDIAETVSAVSLTLLKQFQRCH
jgi:hypothetical protein